MQQIGILVAGEQNRMHQGVFTNFLAFFDLFKLEKIFLCA